MLRKFGKWTTPPSAKLHVDDVGIETAHNPLTSKYGVASIRILYHRISVKSSGFIWRKPARTFYRCEVVLYPSMTSYRYQINTADREEMISEAISRVGESISTNNVLEMLTRAA